MVQPKVVQYVRQSDPQIDLPQMTLLRQVIAF